MTPYPAWGNPDYPFALRNAGDAVLLLDQTDTLVDAVVWGDGVLQEIVPHPGTSVKGASLERVDPTRDTDDCALDFTQRYPPTPGSHSDQAAIAGTSETLTFHHLRTHRLTGCAESR